MTAVLGTSLAIKRQLMGVGVHWFALPVNLTKPGTLENLNRGTMETKLACGHVVVVWGGVILIVN